MGNDGITVGDDGVALGDGGVALGAEGNVCVCVCMCAGDQGAYCSMFLTCGQ